jgi:hypothetical protein
LQHSHTNKLFNIFQSLARTIEKQGLGDQPEGKSSNKDTNIISSAVCEQQLLKVLSSEMDLADISVF